MERLNNREFLVKISSLFFILFLFSLVLIPIDNFLLNYASNKRKKYITKVGISPEIQRIAEKSTSYKDSGRAINEGSLINSAQKGGYHHGVSSDYESFGDGKKNLWILGDSWIARLKDNHFSIFEENLKRYYSTLRIFSNSSWSPLLHTLVLRYRSIKYNQKPDAVAIYLDQTDIGDDFCRYRPVVERDKNNMLKRVHINKFNVTNNNDYIYHVL